MAIKIANIKQMIELGASCSEVAGLFAASRYTQTPDAVPGTEGKTFYSAPHSPMHLRDRVRILPPPPMADTARIQA